MRTLREFYVITIIMLLALLTGMAIFRIRKR